MEFFTLASAKLWLGKFWVATIVPIALAISQYSKIWAMVSKGWRYIKVWFSLPKLAERVKALEEKIEVVIQEARDQRNGVRYCPNCDQRMEMIDHDTYAGTVRWKYACEPCSPHPPFWFKAPE